MEDDGGGFKLSKKSSVSKEGEVDYRTKAGTAWSHNFLNQKPWHPLSYPNQRRKWIAEQTHAQKQRRDEEIAREYAQEQDFLRQAALLAKKEKEKLEMMKGVSFMYAKPPGYNPESAKAAEATDEKKKQEDEKNSNVPHEPSCEEASSSRKTESAAEKKKQRPKDVFGRVLPTEEQFEVLKNAPKLDTGVAGRAKPFGVEIRNVKCLRCGNYGHQSGDRECPLKDVIMPNEESRLKRDDPLTTILAQTDPSEPLKWELKQKPGLSPPRGGFDPEDPNQQIVAEDIFDEYGGFLGESVIPELLNNFNAIKTQKKSSKSKHKRRLSPVDDETRYDQESDPSSGNDKRKKSKKRDKKKAAKAKHSESSSSESVEGNKHKKKRHRHKHRRSSSSEPSDSDDFRKSRHRGPDQHRDQDLDMDRHRDADPGADRHQRRDRDWDRNGHQPREQYTDRDQYRDRDRDRDQIQDRRRRQDQDRDRDRDQDKDPGRHRDQNSNHHQHRDQNLERHQHRERERDLERHQHRERDWDLERHQHWDRDRERQQHRERDRDRHRNRHRH